MILLFLTKVEMRFIVSIFLCFILSNAFTQEEDFQIWLELEACADLGKNFSICIENETRFYENASLWGRNQTDIGLAYDFNKLFSVAAAYRYLYYYPFSDLTYNKSRWVADLHFKPRYKRWRFSGRLRLVNDNEGLSPNLFDKRPLHRERFRAIYNFRKSPFRAGFGTETYFPVGPNFYELRKLRLFTGVQYRVSRDHRFGLDFIYDREFNTNNPLTAYIISVSYTYKLGDLLDD